MRLSSYSVTLPDLIRAKNKAYSHERKLSLRHQKAYLKRVAKELAEQERCQMSRPSDEAVEALLELRFQVAELFMPGMWKKSPGGDLYIYEGPTSLIDSLREAYDDVEEILIMEDDEEESEL